MRLALWIVAVVIGLSARADAATERVEIPNGPAPLAGYLFKPKGSGPFPAVVALHGCAGLSGRNGLRTQYGDWGERLAGLGFVVFFPDSYGSRGLGSQCRVPKRTVRASRERVSDAHSARRWLQAQSFIVPDRVSLIGWAGGGVAALWTIRRKGTPKNDGQDFRAAAVLYPRCQTLNEAAWSARVPTLIMLGESDDWAPSAACEQMVKAALGRSARLSIITYPGAYHGFDHPNRPLRQETGLAFTADGTGRAHTGTNPAARADALRRIPDWFAR